jgi:hypothetical protein
MRQPESHQANPIIAILILVVILAAFVFAAAGIAHLVKNNF